MQVVQFCVQTEPVSDRGCSSSHAKRPADVLGEKPLLVYPIGGSDDDPETLLEFEGLVARPKLAAGFGRLRALSMIELFRLNDWAERKELLADRCDSSNCCF